MTRDWIRDFFFWSKRKGQILDSCGKRHSWIWLGPERWKTRNWLRQHVICKIFTSQSSNLFHWHLGWNSKVLLRLECKVKEHYPFVLRNLGHQMFCSHWASLMSGIALWLQWNYGRDKLGPVTLIKLNKMKGLGKRTQSLHNKIFIKYYGIRLFRKEKNT